MHTLLYRSSARPGLLASDLNDIINESVARNPALGITGLLLHGRLEAVAAAPGEFVQWIEGPEDAVESLYERIEDDPRHTDADVLHRGPTDDLAGRGINLEDGRLFPDWSMRLVRMAELPATLDGFLRFAADRVALEAA